MNDEEIQQASAEELSRDLWATGLQPTSNQAADLAALGWRKHAAFEVLAVPLSMDAGRES